MAEVDSPIKMEPVFFGKGTVGTHLPTGGEFLKKKYDLHNSPEVNFAAERSEFRTGMKIPLDPENRIRNYLARFEEITGAADPRDREKGVEALKHIMHERYVIKPGEVPKSYAESQARILRERGQGGDWNTLSEEQKNQLLQQGMEAVINDQKESLDTWIDYFASPDAMYPTWLKYYATRSISSLATYDKDKQEFPKRSRETVKPFPELNREALSYVLDALETKYKGGQKDLTVFEEADRLKFQEILKGENFANLYAWAIEKVTPASTEQLRTTNGKWIKYPQGSEPEALVDSIGGKGTGWCTAGESTARTQLQGGDFYVYYSNDEKSNPAIPRVAIRMDGQNIGEVRGIAKDQNLDPFIGNVVEEKLKDFPDGEKYKKKEHDMKFLTEIEKKTLNGELPTKDELVFLYEINGKIEGFGYERDPRIEDIRSKRNLKEDAPLVFDCVPDEIAWKQKDIGINTKVYLGPLFPGFFKNSGNIEVYPSFPENKFFNESVVAGGRSAKNLENEMERKGMKFDYAISMMEKPDFVTLQQPEKIDLVHVTVKGLGFTNMPTTDELYRKALELGLEFCPPEVGPALRLKDEDQAMWSSYYIGMKPMTDSDGDPCVFLVVRGDAAPWLRSLWADPGSHWRLDSEFVFRLRK